MRQGTVSAGKGNLNVIKRLIVDNAYGSEARLTVIIEIDIKNMKVNELRQDHVNEKKSKVKNNLKLG